MHYLLWLLKGVAMGAANVIPGVSGGTIAFVTGIYERFINALKEFDFAALKLIFKLDFKGFFEKIDGAFIATIFLGIAISILSLAKVLEYTFTHYEVVTLSFFFGLIIASILGVGRQVSRWGFSAILALIVGISIAVLIAFLPPAEANSSFLYVLICGIVAISSMILPGLSGSYVLLLMGNYLLVLQSISSFDLSILVPLGIGCIIGLGIFSRVLSYLFAHFKDRTTSMLTGFVVGSLLIIWPWKITHYEQITIAKRKAIGYEWMMPTLNTEFFVAIGLMVVGFVLVWWLERSSQAKSSE